MKPLSAFSARTVRVVLTDIDGTLTQDGRLPDNAYSRLWALQRAGFVVIPVTGRPAGWCEMIARLWPVDGVVGENGAFYFRLQKGQMRRHFLRDQVQLQQDRINLQKIRDQVLREVVGAAVASDQFARVCDLAIDFAEDVKPLNDTAINQIVSIFERHGATAKVSNIHVNGWFGHHDKVSTCKIYLREELGITTETEMKTQVTFVGDSPNDEPMFEFFPLAFAVANIREFVQRLTHPPAFVAPSDEAKGFCEIADHLLVLQP